MRIAIKAAVLQRGLSQRQVARAVGIPENRLSSIVNGWTAGTDAERASLSSVLAQPIDVLFGDSTTLELRSTK